MVFKLEDGSLDVLFAEKILRTLMEDAVYLLELIVKDAFKRTLPVLPSRCSSASVGVRY